MKSFALIILFLSVSQFAFCINDSLTSAISSQLVSVYNKPVILNDTEQAVYMIATKKNCSRCFEDICNLYSGKIKSFYIIVFMERDLMSMLSIYNRYANIAGCVKDVYYFWTNDIKTQRLSEIVAEPSPQLLIHESGNFEYKSYSDFLKLTNSR
ncbi:hypothetical protein VRU48_14940 [Pedobacter sp. KR3-3]|uniref:Uncharacterized protein n=1 Tax=Pedobacter albus TaxID=3113905 RepID=A0ABU7IAC5_9SPHI|nr:hypothetical protein [Pedobacter sp. KR3-3]MEE1946418.1 hypothetical protein [Pedobacter sp. KR3-3]